VAKKDKKNKKNIETEDIKYNSEENPNEKNSKEKSFFDFSFLYEFIKPIKLLIEMHLKLALLEIKSDTERLLVGLASLVTGCLFVVFFWMLINVLLIVGLYEFVSLKLSFCILIDAGLNLFFGIIMFIRARIKLKQSFFSGTRKIIEDTIDELKK